MSKKDKTLIPKSKQGDHLTRPPRMGSQNRSTRPPAQKAKKGK